MTHPQGTCCEKCKPFNHKIRGADCTCHKSVEQILAEAPPWKFDEPTTDTSDKETPVYMIGATDIQTSDLEWNEKCDWRERFRKLFSCECMLCQEKGYPFETTRKIMEAFIEKEIANARAAAIAEVRELAEGMKIDKPTTEPHECGWNDVLTDLISKLK